MKFPRLLLTVIARSDLARGREEALARPITDMLQAWIAAHMPDEDSDTEFDAGYRALAAQLLAELEGSANVPE